MSITTHALSKTYEPPKGWRPPQIWRRKTTPPPTTAVTNVSLDVAPGELFGLLGPNGAGKTTLVKMLCTLIRPSTGTAVIAGHSLDDPIRIKATVGLVVSDERSFYWRLSARRNLDFFAALYGLRGLAAHNRVQTVLEDVQLADMAERRFSHFSSGMRQRLAIARALLHQPHILFLDEPSRSLDPTATQKLHELILRLRQEQGMTIFLITHDLAEAEKLCDQVALMHKGQIQTIGKPATLRRELHPRRHYTIHTAGLNTAVAHSLVTHFPTLHTDGPQIQFQAAEEEGLLTAVLSHLHQHTIPIQSIDSTPPTLEEVFAHYTQEDDAVSR